MKIFLEQKTVTVNEDELDIYAAMELQKVMSEALDKGIDDITLDLSGVSSLSTPAVQVICSALTSFRELTINSDSLQSTLLEDLKCLGIDLMKGN